MSKIEWTDKTWNFITGCTEISPACNNCYAKAMTKRLQGMAIRQNIAFKLPKYHQGWDKVVFHKESLLEILDKKKYPSGSKIFVNSMSDTFHEKLDNKNISESFDMMSKRKDLIFQVLTKRPQRILEFFNTALRYASDENEIINDIKHIYFGVTAENQEYLDKRIPLLFQLKELLEGNINVFVSIEPMLSHINISVYKNRLDWVIVGGEKIPNNPNKARLMKLEWVDSIYKQCKDYHIPFFFKQWGNNPAKSCHSQAESCKEFPK